MSGSSFTQKIVLDGGDQIKASLLEVGAAGKKAFDQIGASVRAVDTVGTAIGLERIKVALGDLATLAGTFSKSLSGNLLLAGGAFVGIGAAMSAIGLAAESSTNKLVESAKKLGTSTEDLQRLRFAASSAGIGEAELSTALGKIKSQFDEAGKGAKTYFRSLSDIGTASKSFDAATGIGVLRGGAKGDDAGKTSVNFRSLAAAGGDYLTVIRNLGEALAALDDKDPRKKSMTDNLEKQFGKDFASKIEDLGTEIRSTEEVYNKLGLSIGDTDKAISKAHDDSLDRLKLNLNEQKAIIGASVSAIGHQLGMLFVPGATAKQDAISDFIEKHRLDIVDFVKGDVMPSLTLMHDAISAAGTGLSTAFNAGIDAAKRGWEAFKALLSANDLSSFQGWKTVATEAFNSIIAVAGSAFERIVGLAGSAYTSMKEAAISAFPSLAGAFTALENGFSAVMERLKAVSGTTWLAIGAGVLAFALLFSGSFGTMALAVIPFWSEILRGAEALAPGLAKSIGPIRAAAGAMFESVTALGRGAFGSIKAMLADKTLLSADGASVGGAFGALRPAAAVAWADVRAAFVAGARNIRVALEDAFPSSGGLFSGMEASFARLSLAVTVLTTGFAWFLNVISLGKIHVSGMEAAVIGLGLHMSGLLPLFTSAIQFMGLAFSAFAILLSTLIRAVIVPVLVGMATNPAFAIFVVALGLIGFALYKFSQNADAVGAAVGGAIQAIIKKVADLEKNSLAFKVFEGALRSIRDVAVGVADALDRINAAAEKAGQSAHNVITDAFSPSGDAKPLSPAAIEHVRKQRENAKDPVADIAKKVWKEIFSSADAAELNPQTPKANVAPGSATGVTAWAGSLFGASPSPATQPSHIVGGNFKSADGSGGGIAGLFKSFFGDSPIIPGGKKASSAKPATKDLLHESDDEARIRDDANRYFGMPVIGKRALDASVGRNDQFVSEGAMKRSVERNTSDFPVYPGYLPKGGKKGDDDEASNLSGSIKSTASAFDGLIGKMGQFAAALVAPGGGGLQMAGLGRMAMPQMAMAPAFAGGGSQSERQHAGVVDFTYVSPGGTSTELSGLRSDVDKLKREAVADRMASTTKYKSSWDS
jgi:hypothetical protein